MLTVLILILAVIFFLYYYITRNDNYWKKRNIPYAKPSFYFGNYKKVISGQVHFAEMFRELYGNFPNVPYFGYFKLTSPGLVIRDPEIIKMVVIKDFSSFDDNDFKVDAEIDPIWNANIFTQNGDKWKKNRTAWGQGMTASKIKGMQEIMFNKSNTMVEYLQDHIKNKKNTPLDAKDLVSNYMTDVLVTSVLGFESNSIQTPDNPFKSIITDFQKFSFWEGVAMLTFVIAPWLSKILKFSFVPKQVQKQLIDLSRSILENRRKNGYQKNNIFDAMLEHVGDVNSVTEVDVAGFLFNFLLDGVETSSMVTSYFMYSLAANPQIQSKLREEIDDAFERNNGKLTYDDINQLTYLNMTFQETLRLYPIILSMNRLCTKPYQLAPISPGGKPVPIPVGTSMIVPVYALHMDPQYFPDPEKYDPERFSEENKANIPKYVYLPFGEGPRICIGSRLGTSQIKICMFDMLRNFELRLSERTMKNPPTIDPNVFIISPRDGIWITIHKRS